MLTREIAVTLLSATLCAGCRQSKTAVTDETSHHQTVEHTVEQLTDNDVLCSEFVIENLEMWLPIDSNKTVKKVKIAHFIGKKTVQRETTVTHQEDKQTTASIKQHVETTCHPTPTPLRRQIEKWIATGCCTLAFLMLVILVVKNKLKK